MYNLFLDDVRMPVDAVKHTKNFQYLSMEWEIVRNYDQFVAHIKKHGLPELVSFDHDLADVHYHESMYEGTKVYMKYVETTGEKTGSDCVKWLIEYCMDNNKPFPKYWLHTMNPAGKENMESLILTYLKYVENNVE
jgi:DhnA family fructose-bisphosphate aldolase class Ia